MTCPFYFSELYSVISGFFLGFKMTYFCILKRRKFLKKNSFGKIAISSRGKNLVNF